MEDNIYLNRMPRRTHYPWSVRQSTERKAVSVPSILQTIRDQPCYMELASLLLRLAQESGVPSALLSQLETHLQSNQLSHPPPQFFPHSVPRSDEEYCASAKGWNPTQQNYVLEHLQTTILAERRERVASHALATYINQIGPRQTPYEDEPYRYTKKQWFKARKEMKEKRNVKGVSGSLLTKFVHLKTMFGHIYRLDSEMWNPVYNVVFDKTNRLVMTSSEEGCIKVWSRESGHLVAALHNNQPSNPREYVHKLDVTPCNKYLLSAAGDGVSFYDLKAARFMTGWQSEQVVEIVPMQLTRLWIIFCDCTHLYLLNESALLHRTATGQMLQRQDFAALSFRHLVKDDNVQVLIIANHAKACLLGLENGQIILFKWQSVLGSANEQAVSGTLLVHAIWQPHSKEVLEVRWSPTATSFVTGSRDGLGLLWQYSEEESPRLLERIECKKKKLNFACNIIVYNCTGTHLIVGFHQLSMGEEEKEKYLGELIIYDLRSMTRTCQLTKECCVEILAIKSIDAHPFLQDIILVCEHGGNVLLYDIRLKCLVNFFEERGFHFHHPQFQLVPADCKFADDGMCFAVTSEMGTVSLYGYDVPAFYQMVPVEQFLSIDFQDIPQDDRTNIASNRREDRPNIHPVGHIDDAENVQNNLQLMANPIVNGQNDPQNILNEEQNNRENNNNSINPLMEQQIIEQNAVLQTIPLNRNLRLRNIDNQPYNYQPEIYFNRWQASLISNPKPSITYLNRINHFIKQNERLNSFFSHNKEQMQSNRHHILFLQRERMSAKLKQILNERLKSTNKAHQSYSNIQKRESIGSESVEDKYSVDENESFESISPQLRRRRRYEPQEIRPKRYNTRDRHEDYTMYAQGDQDDQQLLENYNRTRNHHRRQSRNNRPIKRIKRNQNAVEEQPQVQDKVEEEEYCLRCNISPKEQKCYRCNYRQEFCEKCSLFRGKQVNKHFKCFICLYLNNSTEFDFQNLTEDAYRQTKTKPQVQSEDIQVFIPQVGDRVYFFFQGYEQFLQIHVNRLSCEPISLIEQFRILPHTQDVILLQTPCCTVTNLRYFFPVVSATPCSKSLPYLLVSLKYTSSEQSQEQFHTFFLPGCEYLLLEEEYKRVFQGVRSELTSETAITYEGEQVQLVDQSLYEETFPTYWKTLRIRKRKKLRGPESEKRVNLWRVIEGAEASNQLNNHQVVKENDTKCVVNNIIPCKVAQAIKDMMKNHKNYNLFQDYVDFEIYEDYRYKVEVGMCIGVVCKRITEGYYRSWDSLLHQLKRIPENSEKYNENNKKITQDAYKMVNKEINNIVNAFIGKKQCQEERQFMQEKQQIEQNQYKQSNEERQRQQQFKKQQSDEIQERRQKRNNNQINKRQNNNDWEHHYERKKKNKTEMQNYDEQVRNVFLRRTRREEQKIAEKQSSFQINEETIKTRLREKRTSQNYAEEYERFQSPEYRRKHRGQTQKNVNKKQPSEPILMSLRNRQITQKTNIQEPRITRSRLHD